MDQNLSRSLDNQQNENLTGKSDGISPEHETVSKDSENSLEGDSSIQIETDTSVSEISTSAEDLDGNAATQGTAAPETKEIKVVSTSEKDDTVDVDKQKSDSSEKEGIAIKKKAATKKKSTVKKKSPVKKKTTVKKKVTAKKKSVVKKKKDDEKD